MNPARDFPYRSAHAATDAPSCDLRASHATDLGGKCPTWVELIPAGTFKGFDGRGPYHNTDPETVIKRSMAAANGGSLLIDCGHEVEESGYVGARAEAGGWITELRVTNGAIEGKVDWTSLGRDKVGGKLYRFISPVFFHDAKGVVGQLAGAALTNRPNLALKSLNSSHQEHSLSDKLKALMARLLAPFSMPETTDEDALVARVTAAAEAEKVVTKVVQAFQLAKTATAADVERALQSAVAAKTTLKTLAASLSLGVDVAADDLIKAVQAKAPDTTRFIPVEQHLALVESVKSLHSKESARVIDEAVRAGKILPVLRDHYIAAHSRDAKGTEELIDKMPVVVKPGTEVTTGKKVLNASEIVLTDSQKAICASTGVKEDDFKKTLAAEAAAS